MTRPTALACVLVALLLGSCASRPKHYPHPSATAPLSRAIRVGNTLYVSGHLGLDPETRQAPADAAAEIRLCLDAFEKTLANAGATMDDLVRVQVFCSDLSLYGTFNDIYRARFESDKFPTRAFIGSGRLLRGCRFEVQGIAVVR